MPTLARVNFFGGPGVGKSTLARDMCSALGNRGLKVELIEEVIKAAAWEGLRPRSFDGAWLHANQLHAEDVVLRNGGITVSAGPLFQQCAYASGHRAVYAEAMLHLSRLFEDKFPSINVYVVRNIPFSPHGRYQKDAAEAEAVDSLILHTLAVEHLSYTVYTPSPKTSTVRHEFDEEFHTLLNELSRQLGY